MADENSLAIGNNKRFAKSLVFGFLTAAGSLLLLLLAMALFMPSFLRFTQSNQARLLPGIMVMLVSVGGLLR